MIVTINANVPHWQGTKGIREDKIPGTDWYNVRVTDTNGKSMRLALKETEFN